MRRRAARLLKRVALAQRTDQMDYAAALRALICACRVVRGKTNSAKLACLLASVNTLARASRFVEAALRAPGVDKQRPLTHFLDAVFFFEVLFFFFFERVAVRFAFLIGK